MSYDKNNFEVVFTPEFAGKYHSLSVIDQGKVEDAIEQIQKSPNLGKKLKGQKSN